MVRELRGAGRGKGSSVRSWFGGCGGVFLTCRYSVPYLPGNSSALGAQEGTVPLRSVLHLW